MVASRTQDGDSIRWLPEEARVRSVILKLARGHIAFEQNEPRLDEPDSVSVVPLCVMDANARAAFESSPDTTGGWPEVGSRAMHRLLVGDDVTLPWVVVQPGSYRYLVANETPLVRIVVAEYLAAEVVWD